MDNKKSFGNVLRCITFQKKIELKHDSNAVPYVLNENLQIRRRIKWQKLLEA